MFQVWYCTSSRSHTTVAKYAEYIATSFKEAKERLGDKFSINPKVTQNQSCEYQNLYCVLSWSKNLFPRDRFWTIFQFSPNLLIRFPSFISIFTPTDAPSDPPIYNVSYIYFVSSSDDENLLFLFTKMFSYFRLSRRMTQTRGSRAGARSSSGLTVTCRTSGSGGSRSGSWWSCRPGCGWSVPGTCSHTSATRS